ncbi:MAG: hypothetical protein IJI73_02335 [Kiritimatiellae bacterium]|nr:hypothetical protein [Kiritimatiellia bacterium]
MKPEKPRGGFLRRFASAFTRDWWLKLVALALATLIYHMLKPENGSIFKRLNAGEQTQNQTQKR